MGPRKRSRHRELAGPIAALLCVAIAGDVASAADGPSSPPLNVLMIVSDALRADALACYGGQASTPNLCALAERGALFERAISGGSWTLPSSVAMFTANHAVEYARRRGKGRRKEERFLFVDDREQLVAEALAGRGYAVRSYLENEIARRANQLQGFGHVPVKDAAAEVSELGAEIGRALKIDLSEERHRQLLPILEYLWRVEADQPFFLLEWILDPHAVYQPPDRWLRALEPVAKALPKPLSFYTRLGTHANRERQTLPLERQVKRLSSAEREFVRRLYLAEVESVDQRVGWLLEALARRGLSERTLVVFTSDHGEGFGEHGKHLHGGPVWDELVHVPLIVAGPGVARGARIATPVSHLDLMPTLAERLGVRAGREDLRGRSLAGLLATGQGDAGRPQYAGNERARSGDALIERRFKLLALPGGMRLFDLSTDPAERHDLSKENPPLAAAMEGRLRNIREEDGGRRQRNVAGADEARVQEISESTLEELRAMGYVE